MALLRIQPEPLIPTLYSERRPDGLPSTDIGNRWGWPRFLRQRAIVSTMDFNLVTQFGMPGSYNERYFMVSPRMPNIQLVIPPRRNTFTNIPVQEPSSTKAYQIKATNGKEYSNG